MQLWTDRVWNICFQPRAGFGTDKVNSFLQSQKPHLQPIHFWDLELWHFMAAYQLFPWGRFNCPGLGRGGGLFVHWLKYVLSQPPTKTQLADSRASRTAPVSEVTSTGGLSGRVDLWNDQMSFGVGSACSSVTLLQIKHDKLDGAPFPHSSGSAKKCHIFFSFGKAGCALATGTHWSLRPHTCPV